MKITLNQIKQALDSQNYLSDTDTLYAVWASASQSRPLLLEGKPGVGKTSIAKALADGLDLPYIRLQMYEGLTDDKILYDYDYQKQLLMLETIKPQLEKDFEDMTANEAIKAANKSIDFYGPDFLIKRPILRAITSDKPCVLCIDEIDKAPEEIEYMLYEFLENYSITIPQLGEIKCDEDKKPIVFITSNGYRELSGALRRRCNYLYLEPKTEKELVQILISKTRSSEKIARGIARCLAVMEESTMRYKPSVAEAISYAEFLASNDRVTEEIALNSLSILVKDSHDLARAKNIVASHGSDMWTEDSADGLAEDFNDDEYDGYDD